MRYYLYLKKLISINEIQGINYYQARRSSSSSSSFNFSTLRPAFNVGEI